MAERNTRKTPPERTPDTGEQAEPTQPTGQTTVTATPADVARLVRERGYDPDRPFRSVTESYDAGHIGQKRDPLPGDAYSVAGQTSGEAAKADLRAATRGRLGND